MPTFQLDLSVARVFSALSHWLGTQAVVAGSVLAGATALVAFRSGLPRWYAWTSAVVALLSALTVMLIVPLLVFVGWIAVTAIVLLLHSPSETMAMARRAGAARPR
jgi:cellulose synthase/poly-beta-1,6-N-acetylglucosamine synthase-like glycosyltransferase